MRILIRFDGARHCVSEECVYVPIQNSVSQFCLKLDMTSAESLAVFITAAAVTEIL